MLLKDFFTEQYKPIRLLGKSPRTVELYKYSIRLLAETTGQEPTLDNLNDMALAKHMQALIDQGRSSHSVNKERSQIVAFWNFAAKIRMVESFPTVPAVGAPDRLPQAWSQQQLQSLFDSCRNEKGLIGGITAGDWWLAIHHVLWDTGERIGAILKVCWNNYEDGWLTVPGEYRKGKKRSMQTRLHTDTTKALAAIPAREGLIFPWDKSKTYIYYVYKRILKRAGLPTDRRSKFHRMRRSVASHMHAAGGDATEQLGHSSDSITRKSYLDPRISKGDQPCDILFRPTEDSQLG